MARGSVLISGGGIAGPALAFWLHRAGFGVTIVERAPAPRPGGQAVDVRGVARTVVEKMGLMPAVRAAGLHERGFAYVDAAGRIGARMPADAFGGEGIVAEIEILRGDLGAILHEATRADVEYLLDDSIDTLTQHDAGVRVTFERAAARTFDVVIGADGTHSRVRALAFGPEREFARPLGAYMCYFTTSLRPDTGGWFLMHNAPGGRMAAIRPDHDGASKAMFSFRRAPGDDERRDLDQQKRLLVDAFKGVGWLVPDLLATVADSPDFYFDSLAQIQLDSWSRGRVALVGDAGYSPSPLAGQGTSLSLVGAYVLAGELAAADGDHRTAFDRYDELMRPYVTQCQELPPGGVNGFLPQGALAIRLRNLSMGMMIRWPMRNLLARAFQKPDAITLPDYATAQ